MTKRTTMNDASEFIFNDDATIKDIIPPVGMRPDIALGVGWYEDMMDGIRKELRTIFATRTPPVNLSNSVIDEIAKRVNAEASYMADVANESKGRGRPVNVGSEQAAAGAQKIAADFDLPAAGDWEESITADLLTLIEKVCRQDKARMEPVSGNRKGRRLG